MNEGIGIFQTKAEEEAEEEGLPEPPHAAPPMTRNPILCSRTPLLVAAQPAVGFSNTRKETFRQSPCPVAGQPSAGPRAPGVALPVLSILLAVKHAPHSAR